jgi:MFS family permease
MIVLAICMALQLTSYVMIQPLFARRFEEFGAGVGSLGASAMAYALAATLAAPFMGALADRFGRRRLVLASLGVYVLAFTGYLFAASSTVFILLRGLAGAFTAGLVPAVLGIVADHSPKEQRARWIGIVNGGASIGWIAGPLLGGLIYDHWGYSAAVLVAIILALVTLVTAVATLPTDKQATKARAVPQGGVQARLEALRQALPRSISTFTVLVGIFFAVMFAWAFIEPRFNFYAYDDLGWSSSTLGLVMSAYGVSLMAGEFGLSQLSDRWGRKPVILLGLVLFSAQFFGLAFFHNHLLITAAFLVAGLGNALYDPALSATLLDIAPTGHQAGVMGLKSTAGSLGSILGPGLLVLFTGVVDARRIFVIAGGMVAVTILLLLPGAILRSKPTSVQAV